MELKRIFKPSTPTNDPDLFRGRGEQIGRSLRTIDEPGRHGVIFGERGVGKTSLAYVVRQLSALQRDGVAFGVRLQCASNESFEDIWRRLPYRLEEELESKDWLSERQVQEIVGSVSEAFIGSNTSPDDVARALRKATSLAPAVIIVDEFDRISGGDVATDFSDLIKAISDEDLACTLLLVGVADSLEQLIEGHHSVERALQQILMPRMTNAELESIVSRGFEAFERRTSARIDIDKKATRAVVNLSQGFPYYTHLLAGALGEQAIISGSMRVSFKDVFSALLTATEEASHTIKQTYADATGSTRKDATFSQTLLACAMADLDDVGFFAPGDVAAPLSTIARQPRNTSNFITHLKRFSSDKRGILETRGDGRRTRYRFRDPLMKPFVLMKGIRDGVIDIPQDG